MIRRALLVPLLLALVAPDVALAQSIGRRAFSGVEVRSMRFGAGLPWTGVSQVVVPFGLVWAPSQRFSFDVGSRYATATVEYAGGASATISGLTDTQARAVVGVVPDRVVLTVSANLPTGKAELTNEQILANGAIAHDLVPYPVSSFGSGASVTSGLAFAVPIGGWAIGVGGSYRVSGEYQALSPSRDTTVSRGTTVSRPGVYRAGGEMRVRAGLDRIVGQGRVAIGLTYSTFAVDEFQSIEALKPGKRYIGQVSWSFPVGRMGVGLYAWDLYRASGTNISAAGAATEKQNLTTVGASATITMGRQQLRPTVEYRRHALGISTLSWAGTMVSGGLRHVLPLGDRFVVLTSARYDAGNIPLPDASGSAGFGGFSAGVTLRANW